MTTENLPGRLFQMGIVVPDLDAALTGMTQRLGTQRFMQLPANEHANWYRDSMVMMNYRLAFGYMGDMQVELIQPISGHSTYSEYLELVPDGGVHHWGFEVEDFDAAAANMEARGYRAIQKGNFGGTRFNYYESDSDPGVLTEIVYLDAAVKQMFSSIRNQTF